MLFHQLKKQYVILLELHEILSSTVVEYVGLVDECLLKKENKKRREDKRGDETNKKIGRKKH